MRPLDPRLRRHLGAARAQLGGVLVVGLLSSLLVIAQAWVVTGLVVAVVREDDPTPWAWLVAATLCGQLVISAVLDRAGVLGLEATALTPERLLGFVLLISGTLLVVLR